jgi:putative ABC transport system substrate-binding protein
MKKVTSHLKLIVLTALLLLGSFGYLASQPPSAQEKPTVGVLFGGPKGSAAIAAFQRAIEELGYHDGKTVALEFRYAEGKADQLPVLAKELVALNPPVIVGFANDAVLAAAKETTTIPIVNASGDVDFVGAGLAKSLEKPGGNVTGVTISAGEAAQLRVELLKTAVPALETLVVLVHPSNLANPRLLGMMESSAQRHGVKLNPVTVTKPDDLEPAIVAAKSTAQAVSTLQGPFFFFQRKLLGELGLKHGLPLAMGEPLAAEAGALLQVNPDLPGAAAASAKYVDKILKGARPADMAIERYQGIQVVLNMKIARALNLNINPAVIRAGHVIE